MESDPIIVVLEDEFPQVLILRTALKCIGEVKTFDNPVTALDFLRSHAADAAIVDIHLPRMAMNGIEFLRAVRKFDEDLCVIVRTGDDSTDLADSAIAAQVFRRAIKTKVSIDELREMTRAAVKATRTRRQLTLDAENAARIREQLVHTLGTIDEELSVMDSLRDVIRAIRNRLTAISGTAEILSEIANRTNDSLLREHAARNQAMVEAQIDEMNSFLDGPYAEALKAPGDEATATANGVLKALQNRFASCPEWLTDGRSLRVVGLTQDVFLSVPALRLIAALRHLVEFCAARCPSGASIHLAARRVRGIDDEIRSSPGTKLVFNRRNSASSQFSAAFLVSCPLAATTLEDIRRAFRDYPANPRVGNLHMIGFTLGSEKAVLVVHQSSTIGTAFELFVPTDCRLPP